MLRDQHQHANIATHSDDVNSDANVYHDIDLNSVCEHATALPIHTSAAKVDGNIILSVGVWTD